MFRIIIKKEEEENKTKQKHKKKVADKCFLQDYNANTALVPWILDEFSYYFETPYNETSSSFPNCKIDRPAVTSANGRMGIVNHMLHFDIFGIQIPNWLAANTTNSIASINNQAALCSGLYGRAPNVVLVSCFILVQNSYVLDVQHTLCCRERDCLTDRTTLASSWTTLTWETRWVLKISSTDCR